MPQANETPDYRGRIAKLQEAMKEFGLQAVVLPARGEPVWVLPGFEEMRARELIHVGDDIHVWQEDESPYQLIVNGLKARGVTSGKVGIDDAARFFVFDGIRKLAPKLDYVATQQVLKAGGVDLTAPAVSGRRN